MTLICTQEEEVLNLQSKLEDKEQISESNLAMLDKLSRELDVVEEVSTHK